MSNVRTVNDFNKEYLYGCWLEEASETQSQKGKTIKSAAFYCALAITILLSFFYSDSSIPGKRFGPFAYNRVLTPSMSSVYPQGSLITSWAVKPRDELTAGLGGGTDIVFVKEDGTVVVHRIIEIMENYEESGFRAFHTQGVNNSAPDTWITHEKNIIGRVTWHLPYAGNILAIIADNIIWVIFIIAGTSALITMLKIVFKKETPLSESL